MFIKKRFKQLASFLLALALIVTLVPQSVMAAEATTVRGTPSNWAQDDIFMAQYAYNLGDDSLFTYFQNPLSTTRLNFMVEELKKALGDKATKAEVDYMFEDVTRGTVINALYAVIQDKTFAKTAETEQQIPTAIDYFVKEGLINGRANGNYELDKVCTVEEAIVFIKRTYEHIIYKKGEDSKGFFWKITGKNNTVYLLGSVHLNDGSAYPLSKNIEDAFASSENLVVEAGILNMSAEDTAYIQSKSYISNGKTIKDYLSPKVYDEYVKVMEALGVPALVYNMIKPWTAAQTISNFTATQATGSEGQDSLEAMQISAALGIDMRFLTKAAASGKNVMELESIKFQIDMFDSFSPELQEMLLESAIEGFNGNASENETEESGETLASAYAELFKAVKDGDDETLNKILGVDEKFDDPRENEFNEKLFNQRNVGMADKIKSYLEDKELSANGDYFVIAGAGHMLGEKGVIALLKAAGYTVERVK